MLEHVPSERLVRAYGAVKLSEKLAKDIRHEWEVGIGTAIIFLLVWGAIAYGIQPSGSAVAAPAGFDWWKAGITLLVGFFKLARGAEFMHWFRKQNGQI